MGVFYTKTGDDGYTGIIGEGRVAKYDPRLEVLGTVDEANSALGMARASAHSEDTAATLLKVQRDLYQLMAEIATASDIADMFKKVDAGMVLWLEGQIEQYTSHVKMPDQFIVPGDTVSGAAMDIARTTVRRAERRAVELFHLGQIHNEDLLHYLNRLSSLCFVLEVYENQVCGHSQLTLTRAKEGA